MRAHPALTAASLLALAGAASAGSPVIPLVLEGDVIAPGNVTRVDNIAVNSFGEWLVEVDTDGVDTDRDSAVLQTGGVVYLQEGQNLPMPAGASLDSFDALQLNDNGDVFQNFFLDGVPSGQDSGIYLNTDLVLQEGAVSSAPGFSAGTPYIGFFHVWGNDADQFLVMASVDDPAIPTTVDRGLVRLDPSGGGYTETVLFKEGDTLDGSPIDDFETGPHESALNNAGAAMYIVEFDSDTATDRAIFIDGAKVAREGEASPLAGRNYEFLTRSVDLNDNADFAFRANLDGDTATDEVIVLNNSVVAQEGVTDINGFTLTDLGTTTGPVNIDNAGNILWYAEWNDPNEDINEALMFNDTILVQEGVTTVDGLLIDSFNSGEEGYKLSDDGLWVIFEATLENGVNGAFLIQVPTPGAAGLLGIAALAGIRRRR